MTSTRAPKVFAVAKASARAARGKLGLSAMTATTLEEKMAGNSRDYNMALQAAEAALRDAEADLKGSGVVVGRTFTVYSFPQDLLRLGQLLLQLRNFVFQSRGTLPFSS